MLVFDLFPKILRKKRRVLSQNQQNKHTLASAQQKKFSNAPIIKSAAANLKEKRLQQLKKLRNLYLTIFNINLRKIPNSNANFFLTKNLII